MWQLKYRRSDDPSIVHLSRLTGVLLMCEDQAYGSTSIKMSDPDEQVTCLLCLAKESPHVR